MSKYLPNRTRLTWAHFAIAVLLAAIGFCTSRCADVEPLPVERCDASRIEGLWQGENSPFWHYEFRPPHLRQWVVFGGIVVTEQEYVYGTRDDSVWASGPGGARLWLVCFPTDSTAEVTNITGVLVQPPMVLRRR